MSTEATGTEQVTTETQPIETPATLAEFREQFPQKPSPNEPPASEPVEKPRRRAKSHVATPDDVAAINALTKELRDAESKITIERKEGESDRVFELRKRAEIAKRAATPPPPAPAPVTATPTPREEPKPRPSTTATTFDEKEPTVEQFANEPDPYSAWQRALARYDRRKEAYEEAAASARTASEAQVAKFNNEINEGITAHAQRAHAFAESRPDVKALFAAEAAKPAHEQIQLPLALRGAIEFHERGPEMIVELLKDPELADELFLLTNGQPVGDPRTDSLVATVRRRLLKRLSGASSGSPAPSRPVKPAPRPPNPERTVPQTPRDTSPSEAPGSLAEFRRQYPNPSRH